MYVKVFEREILDAIIEFLDDRNIDTSDLRERTTTILNSGVIVSGGSIEAQNLAVGARAKAVFARATRRKAGQPAPSAAGAES